MARKMDGTRKSTKKVVRKQGESGTVSKITTPKSGTRTVYSTPSATSVSKTNRRRTTTLVTDKKTGRTYELTSVARRPKGGASMGVRPAKRVK